MASNGGGPLRTGFRVSADRRVWAAASVAAPLRGGFAPGMVFPRCFGNGNAGDGASLDAGGHARSAVDAGAADRHGFPAHSVAVSDAVVWSFRAAAGVSADGGSGAGAG